MQPRRRQAGPWPDWWNPPANERSDFHHPSWRCHRARPRAPTQSAGPPRRRHTDRSMTAGGTSREGEQLLGHFPAWRWSDTPREFQVAKNVRRCRETRATFPRAARWDRPPRPVDTMRSNPRPTRGRCRACRGVPMDWAASDPPRAAETRSKRTPVAAPGRHRMTTASACRHDTRIPTLPQSGGGKWNRPPPCSDATPTYECPAS